MQWLRILQSEGFHFLRAHITQFIPDPVGVSENYGIPTIVIPGLFGGRFIVSDMRRYLETRGIRTVPARIGRLYHVNAVPYKQSVRRIKEQIDTELAGQKINVVGISAGGALAILLLVDPTLAARIERVVVIGTPLRGCPLQPVRYLAYLTMGISEVLFYENVEKVRERSHKLTLIIPHDTDVIAPPGRCEFAESDARHIYLSTSLPKRNFHHLEAITNKDVWMLVAEELLDTRNT